jgi:hypothetical protein
MAAESSPIQFEDLPLDEARTIGRGPRMDHTLYHALRTRIQSLTTQAVRMTVSDGTSPSTMKNRILRVAAELKVPVTIRKVPEGLLFWRSTDEDLHQAQEVRARLQKARTQEQSPEVASRLPTAQPRGKTAPRQPSRKRNMPRR